MLEVRERSTIDNHLGIETVVVTSGRGYTRLIIKQVTQTLFSIVAYSAEENSSTHVFASSVEEAIEKYCRLWL